MDINEFSALNETSSARGDLQGVASELLPSLSVPAAVLRPLAPDNCTLIF